MPLSAARPAGLPHPSITAFQARKTNQQIARERFANLDASELMARWHATAHDLARDLGSAEPKLRLLWFGPDMGLQMFTTARYMSCFSRTDLALRVC